MLRWIGRFFIYVCAFIASWIIANYLVHSLFNLGIRGGMQISPSLPQEHFLCFALLAGLLAGVFPFDLVRYFFFFTRRNKIAMLQNPVLKHPQDWVCALFFVWLLCGMLAWLMRHHPHSVLAMSSSFSFSSLFDSFWGSGCPSIDPTRFSSLTYESCLDQMKYSAVWCGSIGYSAGGLISRSISAKIRDDNKVSFNAESDVNSE